MGEQGRRWWIISTIVLVLGMLGSIVWGVTQQRRGDQLAAELEDALASIDEANRQKDAALADVMACTGEKEDALADLSVANAMLDPEMPEILVAYEAAFESGDYEQVRALFTDDGILTTASNIHGAISMDSTAVLNDRVDEGEFYRLAVFHGRNGENLKIKDWTFIGGRSITYRWSWDGNLNGSGIIVLRGDKIVINVLSIDTGSITPGTFENHRPYDPGD